MTWRYTTDWTRCVRVWRWFAHPGPAQRAIALSIACGGLSGAALPAAPAAPALPWIGAPGWVQSALPFGPGGYGPGFGGGYGYAGGQWSRPITSSPPSALVPGGLPAVGTAYEVPAMLGVPQRATLALSVGAGPAGSLPIPAEGGASPPRGGRPLPTSDTPTDVPCPPGVAMIAVALAGLAVRRRWG